MKPAELIAANLAALPHPDGAPRQLAGFTTALLPDALREQVTRAATDIGDAIVHLLETNGYRITTATEPAGDTPTEPSAATPVGHLHCTHCDTRLLSLNLVDPAHIMTDGRALLRALAARGKDCPHDAV